MESGLSSGAKPAIRHPPVRQKFFLKWGWERVIFFGVRQGMSPASAYRLLFSILPD